MSYRVLHVTPHLVPYGAERIVANLALGMDPARFELGVVSLFAESPGGVARQLTDRGIPVFHLDKRGGLDYRMFSRFAKVLRQFRPHVVHTHNYVMRYTLPPALRAKVPLQVHTLHNVAEHEVDRVGRWVHNWAFRGRVVPVSIAQRVSDSYERVYRLPRPVLIPNCIELGQFTHAQAGREKWREQAGFRSTDLLYVCAARFSAQKNHRMLLDAFAAGPAASSPRAQLLLAGDGELRPELERQAQQLNIAGRVHFLGHRSDIPAVLGAADVFVLASLWEGNPLSVMEAMAVGLPVVVTDAGGTAELVGHGRHGFVSEIGDGKAFAANLVEVARDPDRLRSFAEASALHARQNFASGTMIRQYEQLYEDLLTGAGIVAGGVGGSGKFAGRQPELTASGAGGSGPAQRH